MRDAGERLTGGGVLRESQPHRATGTYEQGRAMKQFEAEGLDRLEQGDDRVLARAAPLDRARLKLEVGQQVVREGHKLLPSAVRAVGLGRDAVKRQALLQLRDGLLVVAPPAREVPQVAGP